MEEYVEKSSVHSHCQFKTSVGFLSQIEIIFGQIYHLLNVKMEKWLKRCPSFITPNGITYFRVLLSIPVIIIAESNYVLTALVVFIISALGDYFDGALARAKGECTAYGKLIDPLVDKIEFIILSVYFLVFLIRLSTEIYLWEKIVFAILVCILVAEELFLGKRRLQDYLSDRAIDQSAPLSGKIKLCLEFVGLGFLFLIFLSHYRIIVTIILWTLAVFFAYRSFQYKKKLRAAL